MPDWLNEPGEWSAVVAILATVLGALLWLIRKEIQTTKHEFRPNHGNSMRDVVNRIEANQQTMLTEMAELRTHQYEQQERLFNSVGKVHARIDEHISKDHLRKEK